MKYVHKNGYVEHHPESEKDLQFLRNNYGASGDFDFWCVAKKQNESQEEFAARIAHDLRLHPKA